MKILVTGGGGFLGRYIVEGLLREGHRVSSLGRSPQPELTAMGVEVFEADLQDQEAVDQAFRGQEVIFHVAAKAGIWGSRKSYYDANVMGSRHVLTACKKEQVKYLIYTSTPSVVFNGQSFCGADESLPYGKNWLCHYAETKAIAEKEMLEANSETLRVCALRPHLIFGPRDTHLLPRVLRSVLAGRLKIVGKGDNKVDVSYVEDVADAHLKAFQALQTGQSCGKAYFISQGKPVILWEWLNGILEQLSIPRINQKISLPLAYALGYVLELAWRVFKFKGEPSMTRFVAVELAKDHYFDSSNAKKDLGFQPKHTMDEAVRKTVEDLKRLL